MYFIADHLNHTRLLDNFAGWTRKAYAMGANSPYKERMDNFLFNFYLLSKLNNRIIQIYDGIIGAFEAMKHKFKLNTNRITVQHPDIVMLINEYDSFFKTLKILHDEILLLAKTEAGININVAHELERGIKKLDTYGFDQKVINVFDTYWNEAGQYVIKFQNLVDYIAQIINNSYLVIDPNTELIFVPPEELLEEFEDESKIPQNLLHFIVLSYNLFRQLVEDLSIHFGHTQELEFERFFPKNLEVSTDGLKEGDFRTMAVYFYEYGINNGVELFYNKDMKLQFSPFKQSK